MQEILNILHDQQRVLGVVVFRGIAGFGDSGEVHASDMLRLNVDLPLVIEFFDKPAVVRAASCCWNPSFRRNTSSAGARPRTRPRARPTGRRGVPMRSLGALAS